jgi:pSer/pThr/pTyr-binding forkhead associated (FHA) protein
LLPTPRLQSDTRFFKLIDQEKILVTREDIPGALVLDSEHVSSKHAFIWKNLDRWCVEDLESKNGTFLNGVKLDSNRLMELKNMDQLRFGEYVFTFVDEAFDSPEFAPIRNAAILDEVLNYTLRQNTYTKFFDCREAYESYLGKIGHETSIEEVNVVRRKLAEAFGIK